MILRFILCALSISVLIACEGSKAGIIVINSEADIKRAGPFIKLFYGNIAEHKFDSLFYNFSISGKDTIVQMQRLRLDKMLGSMVESECYELSSKRTQNQNTEKIEYSAKCKCRFETGQTEELFEFELINGKAYYKAMHVDVW